MAQKIIQMQMRHLYFNLKDLFSNRKGFVILTSLLRFENKSREFREFVRSFFLFCFACLSPSSGTAPQIKIDHVLCTHYINMIDIFWKK